MRVSLKSPLLLALSAALLFLAALASVIRSSYAETTVELGGPKSDKVYVLKHPDPSIGTAFVRTDDRARLNQLMHDRGYELVVKKTDHGVEPVLGDVVPSDLAQVEKKRARKSFDLGFGLNIGALPGGKLRVLSTHESGFTIGVDLDAGTILFISDVTASVLLGYSFEAGRQVIRPYATVGIGMLGVLVWEGGGVEPLPMLHVGAGVEWKPAKWFGLGLEAGVDPTFVGPIPYLRLTTTFYVR